ncbi:hypothetical protein [Mycolicibacterium monacense]|uniref:Fatty acyl-AMP ligase FadD28 and polyketide synthase n=4 Tax=Mycobacteriaceae TaxID=1762 RepID=A0AAD1MYX6_MYCMB|nr:hypothetical protein [Mycolicibacterium monacense]MDA4102073.1 hypothetical protein [Mycolicibacterium monacense DSM 44395]OBB74903.1 hypothetical protein A6B34_14160 [Mycolicibacterium monacense]OBF52452.1 hypothetical protein A5778_15095 [Mycolicibacterium monacense]ORB20010.1 hypothetical protein BST34_13675 [Mycolicibacterium monacense DSM 44395]QHP86815.1 hypothetical protein EWR22_16460 [Mycolicibacterium monacense DSM 44395]
MLSTQIRPARARSLRSFRADATKVEERPDDRLSYLDQALFLGLRATGQAAVMQCVWVYEHAVDFEGLRRFHHNFGYGLAGRRIEPSPLPFGRHRWVSSLGPPSSLDIEQTPRPRAELSDWIDEHAQLPVDPQWGPAWHMGVLPMTDGSTAISLVGSHCIGDGGGALLTVFNAVTGNTPDLGYPMPGERTRMRGLAADARQTVRDAPEIGRTLVAAAKLAYRKRKDFARKGKGAVETPLRDEHVVVPSVTLFVDGDEWDARAAALGGNSYSLLAGFGATLSERMGRQQPGDGFVPFIIPINDRTLEDTRANAVKLANARIDPRGVTEDLAPARAAIKQALKTMREEPDETLALLPLTPFIPRRAVKSTADVAFGFSDLPVSCSNLGDLPPDIGRIDGSDAEYVILRGVDQFIPRSVLEQRRGLLTVIGARVGHKMMIAVIAYQPGATNTKPHLRELTTAALGDFGLTPAVI